MENEIKPRVLKYGSSEIKELKFTTEFIYSDYLTPIEKFSFMSLIFITEEQKGNDPWCDKRTSGLLNISIPTLNKTRESLKEKGFLTFEKIGTEYLYKAINKENKVWC